ncbi:MAG TPA: hypothetical protein VI728_08645 [Syntrophales bacterium]|nr:hypothetical protein [Syntrophales bacterium]
MKPSCYLLEGTWWNHKEIPLILQYLQALNYSHGPIDLSHKTIRSNEDVEYWIRKIPKWSQSFLYIACHGSGGNLYPSDGKCLITRDDIINALSKAKDGAISFIHFGCCEMVVGDRRKSLLDIAQACGARWVSGYSKTAGWLESTFLELALIAELYLPFFNDGKKQNPKLKSRADNFHRKYEQLARELNFSGICQNMAGASGLIPKKLYVK